MNIALISFAVLCSAASCEDHRISRQIEKFNNIEFDWEYTQYYHDLFQECDAENLERLTRQSNHSIAIQSAWKLVVLDVVSGPSEQRIVPADRSKINWFLGFFEGRTRVSIPNWWRELFLSSREIVVPGPADTLIKTVAPGILEESLYHQPDLKQVGKYCLKEFKSSGWHCPKTASIIEQNGVVTYTQGNTSFAIPDQLISQARDNIGDHICCLFTDRFCFVAIHNSVGWPHLLACVDRKTRNIVWNKTVCGFCIGPTSGYSESCVSLVHTEDHRVICFGEASGGIYAHGFDAHSGKTIFQFSNGY